MHKINYSNETVRNLWIFLFIKKNTSRAVENVLNIVGPGQYQRPPVFFS